ncbi:MAG: hypothetical protein WC721_21080 [Victivallaceae bacterium]|jgi:hypothetical protein
MQKAGYSKTVPDKAVQAADGCQAQSRKTWGLWGLWVLWGLWGALSKIRKIIVQNGFVVEPSVSDGIPRIPSLLRTPRLRKSLSEACVQNEGDDCPKWFWCSAVRPGRCCPAQSRKTWVQWVLWRALSKMTKARKVANRCAQRHSKVCAPSKANVNKPANPARTKPNQQFGTEPGT